jgi:hypothetical protein
VVDNTEKGNTMKGESAHNVLWFTAPIAILLALAAGSGLLVEGLYRDVPDLVAQAKGQDLLSLAAVLPAMIVTAWMASRGSLRARLVWLGGLAYLVYTYASFAFAIRYNPLFLVYIALLGCSLYALIGGFATLDLAEVKARFAERTPVRAVSIYLAVLASLFYLMWLSELIPALLAGEVPQSIIEDGTPTNAIHVLDMAWILPAFAITAVSLWRRQPLGYTLAGISLPFFVLLVAAVLSMAILQAREGNPDAPGSIVIFGALLAAGVGMVIWYLKGLRVPADLPELKDRPLGHASQQA